MPRGFQAIQEASNRISNSGSSIPGAFYIKLPKDGDSATVRFLEQGEDVYSYWYHDFSNIDGRNGWKTKIPCLDQEDEGVPCPGCEESLPRKFQGLINVIWRDAPKYKRDDDGRFERDSNDNFIQEGNEDQIAVWRAGIKVFTMLGKKDVAAKGLSSRDFIIERSGERVDNTTYSVEPADYDAKASPLSAADKKLAKEAYDLEALAGFKDYDEASEFITERLAGGNGDGDTEDVKGFLAERPFNED